MQPGNLDDPLLLQVWPVDPTATIMGAGDQYSDDPVGDHAAVVADGLLHKYVGRVLLVTTGACAVHCRYCFRQNFAYGDVPHSLQAWQPALDYIEKDDSIHEVILSGGDPLTIVDSVLSKLIAALDQISHLKRLRIHTRLPIVLPARINAEFLDWMANSRLSKWMVVHSNHANEISDEVASAIQSIRSADCTVLNQSVLLRAINDSVESQSQLCERLIDIGVLPYYLHRLDRVIGAESFDVPEQVGVQIVEALRCRLPGFAVPKFVCEIAGQPSKTAIL
jgi:EF-P beta-lysylation protein EpmB